ncbi:MAG TPA: phosphoribosyltransferase [Candidatus Caldiarchaeum subterraneum]|uniref:Phosphoribosyltransferase n=1 Tax=Caldiarchaeum subterraneum TaxID=311458 RepID=A0A833E9J2_CALS0|nr:phosphoribosyltransferase [Aigarchaeota archaeon]HIQ29219.1 phosphoribosyltransferase [Candidatus Caldarchaeum subterraneum]
MALLSVNGQRFLSLTWRDIEELVDNLFLKLGETYKPDTIIGVMRGGVIIANLLSDLFQSQEVYVIGCRSYMGKDRREEVKIYHDLILKDLRNRRVLVVDDVSDSGNTLKTALKHIITPRSPGEVRTATLHIKPWTSYTPDYYVDKTDAWIIYPWERIEAIKILGKIFIKEMNHEQVVSELSRLTRVKRDDVERVLKDYDR